MCGYWADGELVKMGNVGCGGLAKPGLHHSVVASIGYQ